MLTAVAATPAPHAASPRAAAHSPTPRVPVIHLPNVPLHTEFVVEVNHKGQVVRVNSAKGCRYQFFNAQTYGNVLQMWIRHPNGSADVGLYRVSYDYNPRTHLIARRVALIRHGGAWGNAVGAANAMIESVRRAEESASGRNLPPLQNIIGRTPTPRPH